MIAPLRAAAFGAAASLLLAACGPAAPPQLPPQPVNVAGVLRQPVTEDASFAGRIVAVESAEIRPRVSGELATVHFREGTEVSRGDLLFTIDDREYRAALEAARAATQRAATRLELAKLEAERTTRLEALGAASGEELAARRSALREAEAELQLARAQQTQAQLDLDFTRVRAPIAGRVGAAALRAGNYVAEGSTVLATVVALDPVYAEFEGDERVYLGSLRPAANAATADETGTRAPVRRARVGLADEDGYPHEGELTFVDNALDPSTGSIRARVRLQNAERRFTPGLFARVLLPLGAPREALLVHERALLTDQDRRYVYVVGSDNRAMRRDVRVGGQAGGLRIVEEGLAPGERVVVSGVRRIFFPGAPVVPTVVPMDQPEPQPSPAR
jgi:multidrug efflux system membrane fusion protein